MIRWILPCAFIFAGPMLAGAETHPKTTDGSAPPPAEQVQPQAPAYEAPGYSAGPDYRPPAYAYPPVSYPTYAGPLQLETNRTAQRFSIYGELMGKTFLWGVGADVNLTSWLGVGASFSYYNLFDWRVGFVAPYVNLYPVAGYRSALLIQAGPEIAFASEGGFGIGSNYKNDSTYVFGHVTLAYEYRNRFLLRPGMTVFISKYAVLPWPGVCLGGSF